MDEGRLTDSYGRTVDFKNTIVIMTSNIEPANLKNSEKESDLPPKSVQMTKNTRAA